jgi:hypothetical protein
MKNIIYLNNKKEEAIQFTNLDTNISKISKNKNDLKSKIIDIKHKLKNIHNEYEIFINFNYQKILVYSIINICNQYNLKNKHKPHIIISYYESTFVLTLCKKLVKENIIDDITIIDNYNIIDEFKKYKKSNTLFGFISNSNNYQYFNLSKLSSYCKYHNIILVSNNENILFNYINNNPIDNNPTDNNPTVNNPTDNNPTVNNPIDNNTLFINNQDIILLNYYSYKNKYYLIYIKKHLFNKFSIFNNQIYCDNESAESLLYLLNIINYNINYNKITNVINNNINNFFNLFKQKYKIIYINEYLNTNKIYYNNCVTIIILHDLFINNITFSILIPNIKYSSTLIYNLLKDNNILINTISNNKICKKLPKEIFNSLISVNISYCTKSIEILKLIKILDNFIIKNNIPLRKIKKKITFSNPEYIILNTPFKKHSRFILKSILKK